ncbi:MAG TPA: hypothetical protein VLV89_13480 [Candidatus Acidoferrum sp.]|nr:hypothetical protein [Candidatus Acidoferrum sp.]
MDDKKFAVLKRKSTADGSYNHYIYPYVANSHEVTVEVNATVVSRWNVSEADIKQAIEILIQTRIKEGWSPGQSNHLVLDEFGAMPIAKRLGWRAARR